MAGYTMQLRVYIEMFTQYEEGLTIRDKIEVGRKKLFDFYYPFHDEDYRAVFETNIIRKFYMREIGFETEELFKFQLESWMQLNMPYFNELFKTELIKYDPLTNSQMVVAHEKLKDKDQKDERNTLQNSEIDGKNTGNVKNDATGLTDQTGTSTGESTDDDFSRKVGSRTPDGRLQLQTEDGRGVIEYASDIDENKVNNKSNSKGSSTGKTDSKSNSNSDSIDNSHLESQTDQKDNLDSKTNEVEHFIERRFGKLGVQSYPELIMDFRKALLRVEVQVHKELQELFMLIY